MANYAPTNVVVEPVYAGFRVTWENPEEPVAEDLGVFNLYRKKSSEDASGWELLEAIPYDALTTSYTIVLPGYGLTDYDLKICGATLVGDSSECVTEGLTNLNTLVESDELVPVFLADYWTNEFDVNIKVLYWRVSPSLVDVDMQNFGFELHVDTTNTFDSDEFDTEDSITGIYTRDDFDAATFQNGDFIKGIELNLGERSSNATDYYWKVKITYSDTVDYTGSYESDFSTVSTFSRESSHLLPIAESLLENLPDDNVYNKEILKVPVENRDTILWHILNVYAEEFDKSLTEGNRIGGDNYLNKVREKALYNNFGIFFDIDKTDSLEWVEYRELVRTLVRAALYAGTNKAIKDSVAVLTGAPARIVPFKESPGWVVGRNILPKYTADDTDPDYWENILVPTILLHEGEYAYGVVIYVPNPFGLTLDKELIEKIIFMFIPAHIKIHIRYVEGLLSLYNFGRFDEDYFGEALFA